MNKCGHQGCGGCQYLEMPYEDQLKAKELLVRNLLDAAGVKPLEFLSIQASPSITAYRNKMDYTFGDEYKGGPMTLGMHRRKSFMSVITTGDCLLVDDSFNLILKAVLDYAVEKGYTAYNKKSHRGFLRNLILRRGVRTGELLVNLVTTSETELDVSGFTTMITGLRHNARLRGILHTINDGLADFTYCDELKILYGEDYYLEEILGLSFKVNAFSFFQTNVSAIEGLYSTAISWIDSVEDKNILDLYCGAGVITLLLASMMRKYGQGRGVATGVEISPEAVRDAVANAAINGIDSCNFIQGDVLQMIGSENFEPLDVIVLDPPRVGVHPKALKRIMNMGAEEMLYISCNPVSLADNLKVFSESYDVIRVQPFDNFPFTKHVETVVLLSKLKSTKSIEVKIDLDEMDLAMTESKANFDDII